MIRTFRKVEERRVVMRVVDNLLTIFLFTIITVLTFGALKKRRGAAEKNNEKGIANGPVFGYLCTPKSEKASFGRKRGRVLGETRVADSHLIPAGHG
jgi:hypothetical protein